MNLKLLEVLVCPICKGQLRYDKENQQLICTGDHLAYPIRNGIPLMLVSKAHPIEDLPSQK